MEKIKKNGDSRLCGNDKLSPLVESGSGEIVLYQPEGEVRLEVRVENDTVWLTQMQMAELFNTDRTSITKHIRNIYQIGELDEISTCAKIAQVRKEGERYITRNIPFYNLDMIISVGYRVNSICGVRFRRWANQVLKDYMLKGYAVNQRKMMTDLQIADRLHEQRQLIDNQSEKLDNVDTRLSAVEKHIDFFVKAGQTPTGGILKTGTRFDGFILISDLVKAAKHSLTFIDPYATIDVLKFAAMRAKGVSATIYSARITPEFKEAVALHNKQYPGLELKTMRTVHDRFLLLDDIVYHLGASFKDMGNEMTAYIIMDSATPQQIISSIQESMKGK